jgi:creatinine amidohydrolase
MKTSLYHLASPDVAAMIASTPVAVLPFGSVEQHGPHLPCGTDSIASEQVARDLADRLGVLHVAFCPFGVTPIHAGHPGTISLGRHTFEALLTDVSKELVRMGVRTLIFVNWHEGNTASLNAVATDLQDQTDARVFVSQACYVAQRLYADLGGSLTHGGGIETMAVMAHDPSLVKLERVGDVPLNPGAAEADEMRRSREIYGFITDVTEMAPEGWHGDPSWATPERAATFPQAVVNEIIVGLISIGALEGSSS